MTGTEELSAASCNYGLVSGRPTPGDVSPPGARCFRGRLPLRFARALRPLAAMPVDGTTVVDLPFPGENEGVRGIYLHIPFCARKCSYCDFYSVAASSPAMTEFRGLLMREVDMVRNRFPEDAAATADTVYFGGGTPTVFPPEALCGLLSATRERFPVEPDAEITAEANPGTVTAEGLRTMRGGGFTRVSIGVQSFTPATLRTLGRIHGVEEVHRTYRDARSAGFHSLGVDLIFW